MCAVAASTPVPMPLLLLRIGVVGLVRVLRLVRVREAQVTAKAEGRLSLLWLDWFHEAEANTQLHNEDAWGGRGRGRFQYCLFSIAMIKVE